MAAATDSSDTVHSGSSVGSLKGDVLIAAGKQYTQRGSAVSAAEDDIDIRAQTIDVSAVNAAWSGYQASSAVNQAATNPKTAAQDISVNVTYGQQKNTDCKLI